MEELNGLCPTCFTCRQPIVLVKRGRIHTISADHDGWEIIIQPHAVGGESVVVCSDSGKLAGVARYFNGPPTAHIIAPIKWKHIPKATDYHFPPKGSGLPSVMSIPLKQLQSNA